MQWYQAPPEKSALLQSKVAISITVKFYKVIQMCTPDFLTDLRGLIYRLLHTFTASHCCGENIHQTRAGIPRSGNMYHPESKNISQANPAISRSTCYQNFYFQQKWTFFHQFTIMSVAIKKWRRVPDEGCWMSVGFRAMIW